MSENIVHRIKDLNGNMELHLPFGLDDIFSEYNTLTAQMVRERDTSPFSRDEWAYLVSFLRSSNLSYFFNSTFGPREENEAGLPHKLITSRDNIAIWLPNNVSLLGPLIVILSLLTGARVSAKSGSRSENLTANLRDYILSKNVGPSLHKIWNEMLQVESFSRDDERNKIWSQESDARIMFGGDESASMIKALPHKPSTPFFAFTDHSSLIWANAASLDDERISLICRVFQIYGKEGCTSPKRLILVDGSLEDSLKVTERLVEAANSSSSLPSPVHLVSDSFMSMQVAQAKGWTAQRSNDGGFIAMTGGRPGEDLPGLTNLIVEAMPINSACKLLPENIQTIGYSAPEDLLKSWLQKIASTSVLRLVPIQQMHHFGPFWDGQSFWRSLFREIDIRV